MIVGEIVIIAAVVAPLVLVPAIILSLQSAIDPICSLDTEPPPLQAWEGDTPFARFCREMMRSIAENLSIPYEQLLAEPCESGGHSYFAEALKRDAKRYGGWR